MVKKSNVDDVLPLSPMQDGILFHALFDDDAPDVYTGQVVLGLDGPLDADRLRDAAGGLLARHANLRAEFRTLKSGRAVQVLRHEVPLPWQEFDFGDLATEQAEQAFGLRAAADRAERFDPARPPLLRCTLVRLADQRHRLLLSSHHLLWDGWSAPILVRELCELYAAHGDTAALPRVRPYRDYLAWLQQQDRQAAESAWSAVLDGLDGPTLIAPAAAAQPSELPEQIGTELDQAGTAELAGAARANGLTVNTVLQGLWAVLLSKLTGRTDVVLGATVSGRPGELAGVESMVGLFINTLPVRVRLRPDEPLIELLRRLQAEQARLLDHQHLGLSDIQRLSGHPRLFDTLLVLESYPPDDGAIGRALHSAGLRLARLSAQDATHYPLTLTVTPGERLSLVFGYQRSALDDAVVTELGRALRRLVATLVADPGRLVGRLDTAAGDDVAQLLRRGAGSEVELPHRSVRELLETQARRTPAATALLSGRTALSHAELQARADRMAGMLLARGAGPESVVAVALPRSPELVVALLAVLKTGAAYLPIDVSYPRERVELMLADAAAPLVVCAAEFAAATGLAPGRTVLLGAGSAPEGAPAPGAGPAPRPEVGPDHPAYVVFTSGSTGRPKGVVGTQRALVNRLAWGAAGPAAAAPGIRVSKSPVSFIDGTTELLTGLAAGETVLVADDATAADPLALIDLMDRHRVSLLTAVPSLLATLVEAAPRSALRSLGTIITSGEALPARLAHAITTRWPHARLLNLYGCSEAAGDSLGAPVSADTNAGSQRHARVVEIGRPIWNTGAWVVDPFLRPVPDGVAGELYLSGAGLARGYLNQPARTAERFVANPFGPPGSRWYRTGDLARRRADGVVEFLGRADDQLTIRGFRVEPAEIEAVLGELAGVGQAAVAVSETAPETGGETGGETAPETGAETAPGAGSEGTADRHRVGEGRLVAYVVADRAELDPAELRRELATRLPAHLVPSAVVVLATLPRTPSGKLDRRALPEPDFAGPAGCAPPRTEQEKTLCALCAEVLGLPQVGTADNFFELGGNSVTSVRLVSRARGAGLVISPRDVFAARTLADLARLAGTGNDTRKDEARKAADPPPGGGAGGQAPADEQALVSLSPAQRDKVLARWRR